MTLHININDEQQVAAAYRAAEHRRKYKLTQAQAEYFLRDLLAHIGAGNVETQADYDRARDQQDWWVR